MMPSAARHAASVALLLLSIPLHCTVFVEAACQSCLLSPIPFFTPGRHHHHRHHIGLATNKAVRFPVSQLGQTSVAFGVFCTRQLISIVENRRRCSLTSSDDGEDESNDKKDTKVAEKDEMSAAMIASIGFYKKVISPLLPPACRFLPTCSQYGVQAIEQFGPQKGAILTAWRLLRCSPFGGKGYDPPKWPPVAYTYGSY
jgi:putative membrane protein insertion efficiency factor